MKKMKIMQINFKYEIPYQQLMEGFKNAAPAYAAVPRLGLMETLAFRQGKRHSCRNILFHLNSELYKKLISYPSFETVDVQIFDVIEDLSKQTRAPP